MVHLRSAALALLSTAWLQRGFAIRVGDHDTFSVSDENSDAENLTAASADIESSSVDLQQFLQNLNEYMNIGTGPSCMANPSDLEKNPSLCENANKSAGTGPGQCFVKGAFVIDDPDHYVANLLLGAKTVAILDQLASHLSYKVQKSEKNMCPKGSNVCEVNIAKFGWYCNGYKDQRFPGRTGEKVKNLKWYTFGEKDRYLYFKMEGHPTVSVSHMMSAVKKKAFGKSSITAEGLCYRAEDCGKKGKCQRTVDDWKFPRDPVTVTFGSEKILDLEKDKDFVSQAAQVKRSYLGKPLKEPWPSDVYMIPKGILQKLKEPGFFADWAIQKVETAADKSVKTKLKKKGAELNIVSAPGNCVGVPPGVDPDDVNDGENAEGQEDR